MLQILSHCERITDEGVRNLVTGASVVEGLQELEIDNCPNISDVTLDVVRYVCMGVQWDFFIKDTLGPANMSTVERLSTLQR